MQASIQLRPKTVISLKYTMPTQWLPSSLPDSDPTVQLNLQPDSPFKSYPTVQLNLQPNCLFDC